MQVSVLALGTWAFGGDWGAFDRDDAVRTIRLALRLGINLFDTAQAYGFGVSEQVLADGLRDVPRASVVIATKGGLRKEGDRLVRDASPEWLRSGVEQSLRNLRTDYIDLYQIHWPDPKTPIEETARALEALVREGKIRHVGVSNFDVAQMEALSAVGPLETLQPPYHMFRREIEERILPYASEHDIGVLAYGPLAHGLLGGRMNSDTKFPDDDWRSKSSDFRGDHFRTNLAVVAKVNSFAHQRGLTLPQLALAWTVAHPSVHVAIVGARRPQQIESTAAAGDVALAKEDLVRIDRILASAAPVRGPSPEGM